MRTHAHKHTHDTSSLRPSPHTSPLCPCFLSFPLFLSFIASLFPSLSLPSFLSSSYYRLPSDFCSLVTWSVPLLLSFAATALVVSDYAPYSSSSRLWRSRRISPPQAFELKQLLSRRRRTTWSCVFLKWPRYLSLVAPFLSRRFRDRGLSGGFYPKQKRASHAAQADILDDSLPKKERAWPTAGQQFAAKPDFSTGKNVVVPFPSAREERYSTL